MVPITNIISLLPPTAHIHHPPSRISSISSLQRTKHAFVQNLNLHFSDGTFRGYFLVWICRAHDYQIRVIILVTRLVTLMRPSVVDPLGVGGSGRLEDD